MLRCVTGVGGGGRRGSEKGAESSICKKMRDEIVKKENKLAVAWKY